MTFLFFLTTLITGIFLGIIIMAGIFAIIVRSEDKRKAARKDSRTSGDQKVKPHERKLVPGPEHSYM